MLDVSKTSHTAYRVAQIFKLIGPSPETTKEYYKQATDFGGQNNTSDLFEKAIEKQKLNKRIADNIKENDKTLPGLDNAKELVKWMYAANKGDVSSQVFEFKDKFVVAHLTGIRNKGTLPLDEVREEVIVKARRDKKAQEMMKEFTAKAGGSKSIDEISSKLGLGVENMENLTFTSFNVVNVGREDALIGTACGLKAGAISKPVIGENGVFIVAVSAVNEAKVPTTVADAKNQAEQV
ncbi:MAG TPA: peptidylprolyl isomerase, partial [Bacteroidia bacterium]|nr:peptidylprolyl isomerase [Bacteroidia bacterium]